MKKLVMYGNPTVENNIEKYIESKLGSFDSMTDEDKCTIISKLQCACKSCDLHYSSNYQNIPAILNPGCKFLFIGRNPNGTEAKENSLFPSGTPQGELFKKYLNALGIGLGEISVINMCNCYAKGNRPPTQEEINKCIAFKKFEMDAISKNVRIIFPMGQDALKWLYGLNHPGVMQCHGDIYLSRFGNNDVLVIPILHPSHVMIDKSLAPEVAQWLKRLAEVVKEVRDKEAGQ